MQVKLVTYGAGSIDVNMYNEAGELKDTKTVTAWNTTSNTVEFEPEASGTYYFEAVAKRTGVAKTYASSSISQRDICFLLRQLYYS